jgi:hypothetical protein
MHIERAQNEAGPLWFRGTACLAATRALHIASRNRAMQGHPVRDWDRQVVGWGVLAAGGGLMSVGMAGLLR